LLAQPAQVPRGARSSPAYERAAITQLAYIGPAALGPGPPEQIVIAAYETIEHPPVGGQVTIQLTASGSGWRVAELG
jgi:hypothetical protein